MYAYVRKYWMLIGVYILLGASGSVLSLGTSVVSRDLVDAVTGVNSAEIVQVAVVYVGVGVSQIFINAVKTRLSLRVRLKVTNEIRSDIYEQVLQTNWESLSKYRSGDLLYRVNGDASMVANTILTFLPNVVTTLISFGGAFVIVVKNDPIMSVIALAGAPVSFLTSRYSMKKMRDFQRDNQEVASDRTVFDQETFQNLQFIKAFGMVDRVMEKFYHIQKETVEVALTQNKFQQWTTIITSLVGQAVGYACYGFAAYRLWRGDISYGTMTMFVSMAGSLRGSFSGIISLMPTVIRAGISAERIMEVTSLPRDSMEQKEEAEEAKRRSKEEGVFVRMENVDFAYEEDHWIYQNADISANPGEIVATLFTGTIADNMRMVKPEATDEEIRQALEAACAWEFVEKLEEGMNTQVRERGTRFSEGQKQRLSIARALLADAPVMILDEATSALDVATERRVLRRIIKKEPHRTILVAAHRPSVFAMCNRVYKIQDHGITQVDEQGIQEFLDAF